MKQYMTAITINMFRGSEGKNRQYARTNELYKHRRGNSKKESIGNTRSQEHS